MEEGGGKGEEGRERKVLIGESGPRIPGFASLRFHLAFGDLPVLRPTSSALLLSTRSELLAPPGQTGIFPVVTWVIAML